MDLIWVNLCPPKMLPHTLPSNVLIEELQRWPCDKFCNVSFLNIPFGPVARPNYDWYATNIVRSLLYYLLLE